MAEDGEVTQNPDKIKLPALPELPARFFSPEVGLLELHSQGGA
jgi:hypothetical protein